MGEGKQSSTRSEAKWYRGEGVKDITKCCRELRKRQTDAERKLWFALRNRQLGGMKFRRQYAIDKYVVDFYCPEYKIAIEADGGQHYDMKNMKRDEARTKIINKYGIKVLRFSDTDILCKTDAVCESILAEVVNNSPHLNPLPVGERKSIPL